MFNKCSIELQNALPLTWAHIYNDFYLVSVNMGKIYIKKMKCGTTAPSTYLHLPRLSLELEVLISGYGCFGHGRETHFGVNESGSPEHTL
jgi:hypothetical protein